MRQRAPNLTGCWMALALALAAGSVPAQERTEPVDTRAAAFDDAFQRAVGPESLPIAWDAYEAQLERLRALLPGNDPVRDARFRSVYCASLVFKDPVQGLAYSDAALRLARSVHDSTSEARALLCRSAYTMEASGTQRGLADVEKAIRLLDHGREPQLLGEALETRGDIHSVLGEQAAAMLDFQRARAAYQQAGISEVQSLVLSTAVAYRRMGDFVQAKRHFERLLARMEDGKDWDGVATQRIQLGFVALESGAPERALGEFQQALDLATRYKHPGSANAALLGLAESQIGLGQAATALHTLDRARAGFSDEHDSSSDAMQALLRGQALARLGQHDEAMARYAQALPLIQQDGNERYLALLYKARAASAEATGDIRAALEDTQRHSELQARLQGKMRLEQSRLLEYEYEIRRSEFENRRLRDEAASRQLQVQALERVRRWQWAAIGMGALLLGLLAALAWRQGRKSRRLRRESLTDALTGTANRPAIEGEAQRALLRARQEDTPLSLLMVDLDHFKTINDRYGHAAGDRVLRAAAAAWQLQLRGRDPLGRIGGEEFTVVCPETSLEQAIVVGNRLREATAALRFDDIDPALRVTASIGAAQLQRGESYDALMARADAALYRAKQRGRDRVES